MVKTCLEREGRGVCSSFEMIEKLHGRHTKVTIHNLHPNFTLLYLHPSPLFETAASFANSIVPSGQTALQHLAVGVVCKSTEREGMDS